MTEIKEDDDRDMHRGKPDPLLQLWAEKLALQEHIGAGRPDILLAEERALCDPLEDPLCCIEYRIAATVPQSIAGAVVLFKLLREVCGINGSRDFAAMIADNLQAGLQELELTSLRCSECASREVNFVVSGARTIVLGDGART
jgi:hypothetical protein